MNEIEIQKLELQLHNLKGRIMQANLALAQIPEQEKQLQAQIVTTNEQIAQAKAQLETLVNTTDVASI